MAVQLTRKLDLVAFNMLAFKKVLKKAEPSLNESSMD